MNQRITRLKKTECIFIVLFLIVIAIALNSCNEANVPSAAEHIHEYGEWIIVQSPTCTAAGLQERFCACGEKQTNAVAATGHSLVAVPKVEATCTIDGSAGGYDCSVCGAHVIAPTVIPAHHSYNDGVVKTKATCKAEGTKIYTCTVCGATKTEQIEKIEHTYDDGKVTKNATCTEAGTKLYTCKVCKQTKTEPIEALGHDPNENYICRRCGAKCPVNLNMTASEKSAASSVHYIAQREIYHDDSKSQFRLQFALETSDETQIAAPAVVEIKIVNDDNVTVYSAIKTVRSSDFGTWTRTLTGAKNYLATIYINDSEITPGKSEEGTIYFKVYNEGYFSFSESSLSISDDLPLKETSVWLPSLPQTISYSTYTVCTVTGMSYEVSGDDLYIYFTLEKTYDAKGNSYSRGCKVGWKLYDSEDYIIESGTFTSDAIKVGEKIRNGKTYAWDCIEPGETYRLEILSVD